jgi:predicted acetyltransferase
MSDRAAFEHATSLWDYSNTGFLWSKPAEGQSYEDFVQRLQDQEKGVNLPEGWVPCTAIYAFVGQDLVGRVNVRHQLNDFLLNVGGHIGYGVVPPYRGQGIATHLLGVGLEEARRLGIARALVTCNEDNDASARVIEKQGGVFENHFDPGGGVPLKRRYWIEL